ncbi:MAG TPA: rhomboid family intramembrane serine protease [Ilumatobacteraceae bacterium]
MSIPAPPSADHCYRHPDRETGRRCTRCGKPACSECLTQATVGSHCPDCVKAAQPDIKTRVKYANAKQNTLVTKALIAINVAAFLWVAQGDPSTIGSGLGGSDKISLRQFDLGISRDILHYNHEWYRIVTSGFLHFGIIHIGLNMWALWLFGQLLERSLGRGKFALLYFASLLAGSFGALVINPHDLSGGASGAVFGLLGAAAIAMHRQGINILQTPLGRVLVLNIVLTLVLHDEISVGGHAGGLIAGAICGAVMLAPRWKPTPEWSKYATPVVVGLLSIIGCVVLAM